MKTAIALFAAALSVTALATNASAQPRMASNLGTTFPSVVAEKGSNILQQAGPSINTGSRSSISGAPIPSPSPRVRVPAPDKHNATQTQAPFQTKASPTEEWVPSAKPAANTSFGTRSGGGFKLASNKAELGTGAIGVIHPSYMPNPDKLWGLDEDSLTEGSAGEIDILSNTSIVPAVSSEAIGIIHPSFIPIDPEAPGNAMAYRLIAALIEGDPDRPNTTTAGQTEAQAATAIEYGLIAGLIGGTADPGGEGTYMTTTDEADAAKTFDYCVIYPDRCTVSQIERPTFGPHILSF